VLKRRILWALLLKIVITVFIVAVRFMRIVHYEFPRFEYTISITDESKLRPNINQNNGNIYVHIFMHPTYILSRICTRQHAKRPILLYHFCLSVRHVVIL